MNKKELNKQRPFSIIGCARMMLRDIQIYNQRRSRQREQAKKQREQLKNMISNMKNGGRIK